LFLIGPFLTQKVGTYGDVVVSDAIVKKVPGFNVETAWNALHKSSYSEDSGGHNGVGKVRLLTTATRGGGQQNHANWVVLFGSGVKIKQIFACHCLRVPWGFYRTANP